MKTKPVPTSPKVRKKEKVVKEIYSQADIKSFVKPPARPRNGILIIILAIIVGFIAGILGETILNALAVSYPNIPVIRQLYPSVDQDNTRIIIQKSEKSIKAQELEIQETLRKLSPSVVTIFPKKADQNETGLLAHNYKITEALGNGIILTNDGLVMTTRQVIKDSGKEYLVLTSDKKLLPAEKIIMDPSTEAVFFRVKAKNLSVVEFVDPTDLLVGQNVLTLKNSTDGSFETMFTKLRDLNYFSADNNSDLLHSSEIFSENILIADSIPSEFIGAPVVTTAGKTIGIVIKRDEALRETNLILPSQNFRSAISNILKQNAVKRVYLGIHYLDVIQMVNIPNDIIQGQSNGALVYGDETLGILPIQEGSPAEKAALKSGDIIIKVEDKEVNQDNSLTKIIQEFEPKEKVKLVILREKKEKIIEVELAELAT